MTGCAGELTDHQQPAGGLGVGEQQQLVLADRRRRRCGRTQSRLRRVPPETKPSRSASRGAVEVGHGRAVDHRADPRRPRHLVAGAPAGRTR